MKLLLVDTTPEIAHLRRFRSRSEIFVLGLKRNKDFDFLSFNLNTIEKKIWHLILGPRIPHVGFKRATIDCLGNLLYLVLVKTIGSLPAFPFKAPRGQRVISSVWFNVKPIPWKLTKCVKFDSEEGALLIKRALKEVVGKEEDLTKVLLSLSKYNLIPGKYWVCFWRDYSSSKYLLDTVKTFARYLKKLKRGKRSLLFIGPASTSLVKKFQENIKKLEIQNYAYLINDISERDLVRIVEEAGAAVPLFRQANCFELVEARLRQVPIKEL